MTSTRWLEKSQTVARTVLIVLFLGWLWLPTLDSIFRWDTTAQVDEQRPLETFPRFSLEFSSLRTFIPQLEAYYNDHFGFRKRLIYWGQTWKRRWFSVRIQNNVIIGRKGWLFYASTDPRTDAAFTAQELQQWRVVIEGRRDWLSARGIGYLFVIVPSKQSIYPEYLPAWMQHAGATTKLDQFMAYMRSHSTVEVLDLRPTLLRAKDARQTFFRTDTHWNQFGAFEACEKLIRALRGQAPGLEPLGLDAFELKSTTLLSGNLAVMLAATGTMPEEDCPELKPHPPLPRLAVDTREKGLERISSVENPRQSGRVLVFGDSFMEQCLPFLGYHFQRAVLYRVYDRGRHLQARAHTWIPEAIQHEKPGTVIDEIAEDFLRTEDPGLLRREDLLRNDTQAK